MYFCAVKLNYLSDDAIQKFIQAALNEDVGNGDHSSLASIPEGTVNKAQLIIKGEGVIAGLSLAEKIFHAVDPALEVQLNLKDGELVHPGNIGLTVEGSARAILTSERLVLNCMQRMSGIATYTRCMMQLISGTKARLLDTRKTTPNFRLMEKWAVAIGGGKNHRFGLFDMIMLKDNHVDFSGGISKAIQATKKYLSEYNLLLKIEVETRNLMEVREVLAEGGVDIIMLDNMSPRLMKKAVTLINGRYKTEASGGITEKTIQKVAESGVNFISVGALTHSIRSMDMSLKAIKS